tara:strand:+ start:33701 stop:34381 length:681 start_codon:yes stop_codon:yes gene_type:complete
VGFLKFLHKGKKEESSKELIHEPLLPPKINEEKEAGGLPDFSEESHTEELKLPDVSELEVNEEESPEIPDFSKPAEFHPAKEEISPIKLHKPMEIRKPIEMPEIPIPKPRKPIEMPEIRLPKLEPVEQRSEEAYKYTPIRPTGPREEEPEHHIEEMPRIRGDVFVKAQDYREIIEGLEDLISSQKEKLSKEEKDAFMIEEKAHDKFVNGIEDLQRNLITTENTMFE